MTTKANASISLRLPSSLHGAARRLAQQRGVSVNALITESLERTLREEEDRALYDSFTLLGKDASDNDVSYAVDAQSEVMLRDPA